MKTRQGYVIDERDISILKELQRDARQTDIEIARNLKISEASVRRRIRHLTSTGTVQVRGLCNPSKVGYNSTAYIGIKVTFPRLNKVARELAAMECVHFVAIAAGQFDILAWVAFPSPQELTDFMRLRLSRVPGILRSELFLTLEMLKREGVVMKPRWSDTTAPDHGRPQSGYRARPLDKRDHDIIVELERDARQSDASVARKLQLSEALVRRRIRRMLADNVLSIGVIADPSKVGLRVSAIIGFQVELPRIDDVSRRLVTMPVIQNLAYTAGSLDVIAWALVRSSNDLGRFIKENLSPIPGVVRTETLVNLEIAKREPDIVVEQKRPA